MDWKDLAGKLVGLGAPTLGALIGGPLGGAIGTVLADALGTQAHPQAVNAAIDAAPDAAAAVAATEADWARAAAEFGKAQAGEVGQTMRLEISAQDRLQRWWRPVYAIELTIECAALWTVIVHEFWTGDIKTINALIGATGLLIAYWGLRFAVLGAYVTGRTREKEAFATGQIAPNLIDSLIKAVKGK